LAFSRIKLKIVSAKKLTEFYKYFSKEKGGVAGEPNNGNSSYFCQYTDEINQTIE